MKTILFLFSFMFVSSCVTANKESRDLSAVNTAEGKNINTAFNWKFWERNTPKPEEGLYEDAPRYKEDSPEYKENYNRKVADCLENCRMNDPCAFYGPSGCGCRQMSGKTHTKKDVKVASIGDQNPFNLLKESQNDFEHLSTSQDKNYKDKAPLMLADDYEDCMCSCIPYGSTRGCHEVCE